MFLHISQKNALMLFQLQINALRLSFEEFYKNLKTNLEAVQSERTRWKATQQHSPGQQEQIPCKMMIIPLNRMRTESR